jgi:hypothetical protein
VDGARGLQAQVHHASVGLQGRHGRAAARNAVFATGHQTAAHFEKARVLELGALSRAQHATEYRLRASRCLAPFQPRPKHEEAR